MCDPNPPSSPLVDQDDTTTESPDGWWDTVYGPIEDDVDSDSDDNPTETTNEPE